MVAVTVSCFSKAGTCVMPVDLTLFVWVPLKLQHGRAAAAGTKISQNKTDNAPLYFLGIPPRNLSWGLLVIPVTCSSNSTSFSVFQENMGHTEVSEVSEMSMSVCPGAV